MPPDTSRRPSGRNACPAQNASQGVDTELNVFDAGSHTLVLNVPASNVALSLPEPATSSTFPVCSSVPGRDR